MPQGGARARSGPLPDPNALRTPAGSWTTLPTTSGLTAPAWPLGRMTDFEEAMWPEVWALPQAVMWHAANQTREVALYVRTYLRASDLEGAPTLLTAVRQQQDALGLSQSGMARLRWRIAADEPAPEVRRTNGRRNTSALTRFETIIGGAS